MTTTQSVRCALCRRPIRRNALHLLVAGEPRHQTCHDRATTGPAS